LPATRASSSAWRLHNLLRISQTKLRSRQAKSIPSKGEPAGRTGATRHWSPTASVALEFAGRLAGPTTSQRKPLNRSAPVSPTLQSSCRPIPKLRSLLSLFPRLCVHCRAALGTQRNAR
jgi:hypothetical protein